MNLFSRHSRGALRANRTTLLLSLLLLVVPSLGCSGDETPAKTETPSTSDSSGTKPAAGATTEPGTTVQAVAEVGDEVEALEIRRATHLLPPTGSYDREALERGLLPSGIGIWHTLAEERQKRSVDRHIKGFELVAQSYGAKFRDSRRSAVLRVVAGDTWKSPFVRVPAGGKLSFSYMPYLPGMGGYWFALNWKVSFEVVGTGGRTTSVDMWGKRHPLRPPTGGTWRDMSIDLSELVGREGRFVFEATPTEDSPEEMPFDLVAVFANPIISPATDDRPNLVVISIDTLRKDAISPYGADPARTPGLQAIADKGVTFDQFWSTAPWTLPAYASFFTAEYPSTHGAGADRTLELVPGERQGTLGIASGIPSVVSHFREQGYRTQSFFSNGHLNLHSGLERGFDGYVWYGMTGKTAAEGFHEWTATVDDDPFFAFVQMTDPHWPYVVPRSFARDMDLPDTSDNGSMTGVPMDLFAKGVPEQDREDMIEIYGFLVEYMDKHVASVMKTLEKRGLTENTLVVFHTDHGEEFWDHGEWWHGHTHHAELENVSLIMSWPGKLDEGARLGDAVRTIDVLPTAIDLLGLPAIEHETEGRSFAHLLRGEEGPELPPILHEAELYGQGGDFGLTMGKWRLLVQPYAPWIDRAGLAEDPTVERGTELVQLFNIEEDPLELNNLAEQNPDIVAGMRKRAESLIATALERRQGTSIPTGTGADADASGNMSALGYTGDD